MKEGIALLHYINPFTKMYTKRSFSRTTQLFPEKLQNLNGFEIKVGSFTYSPSVFVKRNESGYPTDVSGPEAMIVKILSKLMNFTIIEVPSEDEWWGNWSCQNKNLSSGIIHQLWHNNLQFMTNQGKRALGCPGENSRSTGSLRTCVLIPILKTKNSSLSLNFKWIYLVSIIVPIWIIAQILKFDNSIWSPLIIMQSMLGFTIPREPEKTVERIVFGSVLIAFSAFSSTFFTILTDMKLTEPSELMINTLEDLSRSTFIPKMQENFRFSLTLTDDSIVQAILNKSKIVSKDEECVEMLLEHKNVACIFRDTTAHTAIQSYRDADGEPLMKTIKEDFGPSIKNMLFESKSPYVRAVDKVLIRLIQSGLINHWEEMHSPSVNKSYHRHINMKYESTDLVIPLLYVLIIGYLLSLAIFVGELLTKHVESRIYKCAFICVH
ncbi:uncharacterized protein LOC117176505 [Belonocnema kinseyi]|uniref:uncharacterized protein LOC117176505 n=1 Tax=Belonocnema kinseyi TaxID=2817044 RepID=UPI00143D5591|nr:uncharacterized protein LOC117176505 [Belonocnema kinseyi]